MPTLPMAGEEVPEVEAFSLADAIQPRREGAQWLYTSKVFEGGRWSPAGSSREDVLEVIEIDGVQCYKVQLTLDWRSLFDRMSGQKLTPEDYSYFWEYVNEQGSYNFSGNDTAEGDFPSPTSLDQFELTLPFPVEKGHRYIAEDSKYEVIDTAQALIVPAGEFTCVVYQILYDEDPDSMTRERFYMAKDVGLVRWEEWAQTDGGWSVTYQDNLIRYDLKLPTEAGEEATKAESVESVTPADSEAEALLE